MEAYLDNSATTRCSKAAADMVYKLLTEDYGNPSSLHMKGVEAENYINDAKEKDCKDTQGAGQGDTIYIRRHRVE